MLVGPSSAFARWLSDKLGYEVRLPHEYEWEVAAAVQRRPFLPVGNEFDPAKVNTRVKIPVGTNHRRGLYQMSTPFDPSMSGNVLEWCHNKYKLTR